MRIWFNLLLFGCVTSLFAQEVPGNQKKFEDFTYRQGTAYRTATGKPGPEYWQNRSDYDINVTLDEQAKTIAGNVKIKYTNNSPEPLSYVWLLLEQNRFKADSRGSITLPGETRYEGAETDGYDIKSVRVKVRRNKFTVNPIITDTRMQLWLEKPIPANGGVAEITIDFSYVIPSTGVDRMGVLDTEGTEIFALAQWYPQMAVLDDIVGWNTLPYLGAGEFYLGYGDFDYKITVPFDHVVVGSGELQNPKEVLTRAQRERLKNAANSEKTIFIISPEEVGNLSTRPESSGVQTWHFKMENSRDVAFASSKSFVWDAAKINLPSGKTALAQSVYPFVSYDVYGWDRSTEYTKASVEFYSEKYYEYPYPVATNIATNVNGMEYPSVSFCKYDRGGESLWGVTDHEFGHNWFPMIVGSNERLHGWLDEGLNMFMNHYSTLAFNDGEYSSRMDAAKRGIFFMLLDPTRETVDTYPDILQEKNIGVSVYYKPALGFLMLREYIIGPERFDPALRSYIETWAYKHPQPKDFFNFMDNALGENLSYFWNSWFYTNDNIDLGIVNVTQGTGSVLLELENTGDIPLPVEMEVEFTDGSVSEIRLPVEIWHRTDTWEHKITTDKTVKAVRLDPRNKLADINPKNNQWSK